MTNTFLTNTVSEQFSYFPKHLKDFYEGWVLLKCLPRGNSYPSYETARYITAGKTMQCRKNSAQLRPLISMIHYVSKIRVLIKGCNIYNLTKWISQGIVLTLSFLITWSKANVFNFSLLNGSWNRIALSTCLLCIKSSFELNKNRPTGYPTLPLVQSPFCMQQLMVCLQKLSKQRFDIILMLAYSHWHQQMNKYQS